MSIKNCIIVVVITFSTFNPWITFLCELFLCQYGLQVLNFFHIKITLPKLSLKSVSISNKYLQDWFLEIFVSCKDVTEDSSLFYHIIGYWCIIKSWSYIRLTMIWMFIGMNRLEYFILHIVRNGVFVRTRIIWGVKVIFFPKLM